MNSNLIREQIDYKMMMNCINKMLEKNKDPMPGSIILGKKYANFYLNHINKMLELECINKNILEMLCKKVEPDLDFIRKDCERRMYYSEDVKDNDNMMSIILDFILTLY